jgi:arylsulfatase A-like enzyme
VNRTVSLIDLAPTVLDLVGLPINPQSQGHSLLEPSARMAYFFTDYAVGWTGLRDGCWKFVMEVESKRAHLFDVCRDGGETADRASEQPARVDTYRRRMEERIVR